MTESQAAERAPVIERDPAPSPTIGAQAPEGALSVLTSQVRRVHEARGGVLVFQTALAEKRAVFEKENERLITMARAASETLGAEEAALRQLTLEAYERTGLKTPAPGVGIRMVKDTTYDADEAFRWAREHGMALQLNAKAFEKLALTEPEIAKAAHVVVTEIPQATIAQDLGKALSAGEAR